MAATPASKQPVAYDESAMENKSSRDIVRHRPSTWVGGTGTAAIGHLADELLANSADEALAGRCSKIWLTIHRDHSITVEDDGFGVPIGETLIQATGKKVPTVQAAFTELFTGAKYSDDGAYEGGVGGMNGMGAKACVFLSRWTTVEVRHQGQIYTQTYRNGRYGSDKDIFTIEPPVLKPYKGKTGTKVTFLYDDSVFDADAHVDGERIERKCYNLSRLVPGLTIAFADERPGGHAETYHSEVGLPDFVADLNADETPLFRDIIHVRTRREVPDANGQLVNLGVEVAFQPAATDDAIERGTCFTNLIHNPDGGTHHAGMRKGITRALNDIFRKQGLLKGSAEGFTSDDTSAGLAFALSIRASASTVQYESQTKKQLTSTWVDSGVGNVVADELRVWLTDHPAQTKLWFTYLDGIRKARLALLAERRAVKAKVGNAGLDPLLDKFAAPTSKDPAKCELYFVEGDSAGGQVKQARDRMTQGVLPFRGVMMNILEKLASGKPNDRKKVIENDDVRRIASAMGTGMGAHFDIEKRRFDKIVLLADADDDGGHITMLWLTALWAMFPEIVRNGHVYYVVTPLYSVKDERTQERHYFPHRAELDAWRKGRKPGSYTVTRFKGLGEMGADQLKGAAMDPASRDLRRIVVSDEAELRAFMKKLMGKDSGGRREYIDAHSQGVTTREAVDLDADEENR